MAGLVIGVPVACTTALSSSDPRDTHEVSSELGEVSDFEWPLTVDSGLIWCRGAGQLVFEADGVQYALNGLAKNDSELLDIEAIWRDDPDVDGLKVDIAGLIEHGNAVCGY